MILLRRGDSVRLIVADESYFITRVEQLDPRCEAGHIQVAMETVAGVWFVVCESCETASLASMDILMSLFAPRRQSATATVTPPLMLPAGDPQP